MYIPKLARTMVNALFSRDKVVPGNQTNQVKEKGAL